MEEKNKKDNLGVSFSGDGILNTVVKTWDKNYPFGQNNLINLEFILNPKSFAMIPVLHNYK